MVFGGFFSPPCGHTSLVCYICCTCVVVNKCSTSCFSSKLAYFIILLYILQIVVNECSDMVFFKVTIIFDYLVIHLAHGCVQQQGRFNF